MATNYPGALDTTTQLPNDQADAVLTDRAGVDHAGEHVNLSDAVRAIEGELGINPAGSFVDVLTRLNGRITVRKTADQSFTSTTLANVTDLSFAIAANTDYSFQFYLPHTTGTAMGSGWAMTISGTNTRIYYIVRIYGQIANSATSADTVVEGVASASATKISNTPTSGVANTWAEVRGMVSQGAGAGTLQVQASRGGGGTAVNVVVLKGAWGELAAN